MPDHSTDPCADIRQILAQTVSDLNASKERVLEVIAQRDDALSVAVELQARIDAAKTALG